MTDERRTDPEERDLLAAEYALGLLSGEELARARGLAGADPAFRQEAGRWRGRLAPLLDEVAEAPPPPHVWGRIERALPLPAEPGSNVVELKRRVVLWRTWSAAATALAASLALVLATRPDASPSEPMVATLASQTGPARLVATWDPAGRTLIVAAAAGMAPAAGHSHQLWLIPAAGGNPHPMGIVSTRAPMRMVVPGAMASDLREGVMLAVSVEPEGGSPTGLPTGPVIASGKLVRT
ncbi:MAG: anti-sigma factor [Alphaproteobacteria bacterium]|nr:anti-sigma factor [Alphaproteobacteria bacterium]MBV9370849.1 anti-sigma factor [Alphaproteobacteria bacterium]MBV9901280.1 anti-sigma factor [Alphaproteobacteria bacterium]